MPKDGDPRVSYAVLETSTRQVMFGRVDYDIESFLAYLKGLIGR